MNKAKDFIFNFPAACGAKNPSRESRLAELVFNDELNNPDSPFKRNALDVENSDNRLDVLFRFEGGEGAKMQCKRLVRIMELNHYKKHHADNTVNAELDRLIVDAVAEESDYPQVKAMLTVDEAVAADTWNA